MPGLKLDMRIVSQRKWKGCLGATTPMQMWLPNFGTNNLENNHAADTCATHTHNENHVKSWVQAPRHTLSHDEAAPASERSPRAGPVLAPGRCPVPGRCSCRRRYEPPVLLPHTSPPPNKLTEPPHDATSEMTAPHLRELSPTTAVRQTAAPHRHQTCRRNGKTW